MRRTMSSVPPPIMSPSLLASLPARSPTPPRDASSDAVGDALRFLEQGHDEPVVESTDAQPTIVTKITTRTTDTPPSKNTIVAATVSPQPRGSAKKVDFSPWPIYHKIPALGQSSSPGLIQRPLPPHNSSPLAQTSGSRPLKSILKQSTLASPEETGSTTADGASEIQQPADFRQMLQSALLQLEGPSRDARRDAYMALNNSIKAYMRVPDPQPLAEKMARVTQCLSRDLAWKDATGRLDAQIVQLALSLTCAILFDPETQGLLDPDFQAFVIDRSIFVLEQADMAKALVKGHLHLLCVQRFPRSVFAAGRAERLIAVMQNIEARNSIIAARLVIYQRLIERAPTAMLNKIRDWIEHVFHALLSNVNDVQRRAIDVCMQMGMSLGQYPQTAKAISELCDKEIEEGQSYGDYLNMQLIAMTSDTAKAPLVPEIWVAVVLCFRNKRYPIGKWPKFRDWLLTIQKCLNSSDMAVKRPANVAWNRLVFTIMPDSSTSELLRSMLKVPILAGLERRGNSELSHQLRQLALESYCNLLHYAMRPELDYEELDLAWDMYVGPVLMKISKAGSKGRNIAFRVLHGLLKKTGGTWNANAANENEPIHPRDLPRLDVRWVRSRLARIMTVMEPIVIAGMTQSTDVQPAIDECWRTLMTAIAEAGSQEVKASNELKDAIAGLINFFRRLWASASQLSLEQDATAWLSRYQTVLEVTVESLGSGHFVDDILSRTSTDEVEAIPNHRTSKSTPTACSPFVLLFALYYEPPQPLRTPIVIQNSALWFLRLLAGAKVSTSGLLGLLQRSLHASKASRSEQNEDIHGQLWSAVADTATHTLTKQSTLSPQKDTFVMGVALKSAASIILEGLKYIDEDCNASMIRLYNAACQSARHVAGNGGIVLAVMEPLAGLVHEQVSRLSLVAILRLASAMAEGGVWPSTRSELDQSRKALWTVSLEPYKMQAFDPFDHVYKFFGRILDLAYERFDKLHGDHRSLTSTLMSSVADFLQRCPSPLFQVAFLKLQTGYITWAEDLQMSVSSLSRDLHPADRTMLEDLQHNINLVWLQLLSQISEKLPQKDSQALELLEPFLVAGFSSSSQAIVNTTIDFWNSSFALAPSLDYPAKLFPVLRERQVQTELKLPGFPNPKEQTSPSNLRDLSSPQSISLIDRRAAATAHRSRTPRIDTSENIYINQLLEKTKKSMGKTTLNTTRNSASKPKPRHDDSQVHFAPIESAEEVLTADSQALTEHQRDVKDRQRLQAQAYPGIASSPLTTSPIANPQGNAKLKFISDLRRTADGKIVVSPRTETHDALPGDDLPSSPTPRPKSKADNGMIAHGTDASLSRGTPASDPPSSPPPTSENSALHPGDDTHEDAEDDLPLTSDGDLHHQRVNSSTSSDQDVVMHDSDLPSDTQLSNAQLQLEDELASKQMTGTDATNAAVRAAAEPETPSRIKATLLSEGSGVASTPEHSNAENSQIPQSSTRKRKRMADTAHVARKRKSQPPYANSFPGSSNGQEEGIEEEIVVAARSQSIASDLDSAQEGYIESVEHSDDALVEAVTASTGPSSTQPAKRKPGRPRKIKPQEKIELSPRSARRLKRSASASSLRESKGTPTAQQSQDSTNDLDEQHDSSQDGSAAQDGVQRKIAQPQSILSRLRGILADCKNMIIGSQEEEREYDDVLFGIRRIVHDAASGVHGR
ncbi:Telomere length regulator protein rif1 [Cercospora beticola]|uniref:Telomere length regulator protein rif1 n=2 Tax=Cercospora beticola TaxID=122368 RepID=A0A2G5I9L9_CERBT|nr:Telomere length regulator protein rif1 [Cercospora beticola]PIB01527.1 Telomere length regulator protein rif1 [Cercospora beticola]